MNNKITMSLVVILGIMVLALGGYIIYDKIIMNGLNSPIMTNVDNQSVDLNEFFNIEEVLTMLDDAYSDSTTIFFGNIYAKKELEVSKYDKNEALFVALYNSMNHVNLEQYVSASVIKSNLNKVFGEKVEFLPSSLSFGTSYNIIYDDSIKKFAYVAPLKVDYSPKYFTINFKTVLKNNEIIVTRKSFYVEYLTNTGTNEYTNAAIYYDHSKKKNIGTVPLRDGVLNKKEIISKFSSKLITQDYVFTKNKKGNYIFSEIR